MKAFTRKRVLLVILLLSCVGFALSEPPPDITLATVDGVSAISWPTSFTYWHLFSSATLGQDQPQSVTTTPSVVNGRYVVPVSPSDTRKFYHLRKEGAILPFNVIEAEEDTNATTGLVVKMTTPPTTNIITPELEASGRGYVELNITGQTLKFPDCPASNAIVIRHCIPDALTGGGLSGTLSLYVNGSFRQKVTLTSTHNWLYGAIGQNGQSNDPTTGVPHVFWDETRAFISGNISKGDTLSLVKNDDDTASFYRIDLIELENVPPPLPPPPDGTFISIADFGAIGTDEADDSVAILAAIKQAKTAGKIVWMPPGTYYQSSLFDLDGVVVQGAGMWYTNLIGTVAGTSFAGNVGFRLKGSGSAVSDLYVESAVHTTRTMAGGKPFTSEINTCSNWKVTNVWITHTNVGFWMSGATNGVVRGCRVRCTYADGINLNRGASSNLVEMNSVRGAGDDGIAVSSETYKTTNLSKDNIVRSNTVTANWSGMNFDLAGGSGHIVEDNLFADNATNACFSINMPSAYQMYPLTGAIFRRNTLQRGGGLIGKDKRGAIWIYPGSQEISGVYIQDNEISDSIFAGITLAGSFSQQIVFERNMIPNPGERGIYIQSKATGSGMFNSNTSYKKGLPGIIVFANDSPNYTVTQNTNSWP